MTVRQRGNGVYRAAASIAHSGLALALALVALAALPEAACAVSGEITNLSGAVIARRPDGPTRILSVRSQVDEGDLLLTAENSFARVKFTDGGEVVLRPGSQFRIDSYKYDEKEPAGDGFVVSLLKGSMRSITGLLARRSPARAAYTTPTATIGIRGTHFGALFCNNDCGGVPTPAGGPPANGLHIDVADGRIVVTSQGGSSEFAVGQFGFVATAATAPVQIPANRGTRVPLPPQASSRSVPGRGVGRAGELECAI